MIKRELPLDILEFFCLTPLPGSEDHQTLWRGGIPMHPDLNRYDAEHVCAPHPKMTEAEWEAIYLEVWGIYYSKDHMRTLLKRAYAAGLPMVSLLKLLVTFSTTLPVERVHPLQSGILRMKHPSELRPGLKRPNTALFWLGFAWETVRKHVLIGRELVSLLRMLRAIKRDPASATYMDTALTPVDPETDAKLELLAPALAKQKAA